MLYYLAIFVGGGLGATMRFAVSSAVGNHINASFPWGTLVVNLIGAFLIGLLVELFAIKVTVSETVRYFLVTGFLGGFTTFSAFSLESASLLLRGDYMILVAYIVSSVVGTIMLVYFAMHCMRAIL